MDNRSQDSRFKGSKVWNILSLTLNLQMYTQFQDSSHKRLQL